MGCYRRRHLQHTQCNLRRNTISNEKEIGVAETLKTVNDDVELYKEVEDLQKSLQSFNIGALSIDQKNFFRKQSSKLRNGWLQWKR
jgi:hypothetical protein